MADLLTRDLLIEIGTEELPPKALERLSEAFSAGICAGLEQQQLSYSIATPYATPRRLAVLVKGVPEMTPEQAVEKRGPAVQAAYDKEGKPTKAAEGFARSCGVTVADLETLETDKGSWLVYRATQAGVATTSLIQDMISAALAALPIPKRMRWADFDYEFVRPMRWLLILFGEEVVDAEIMGIRSDRITRGHRFHCPEPISVPEPHAYASLLEEQGHVLPLFSVRQQRIELLINEAAEMAGGFPVIDPELLKEVASLVEWPVPVLGNFDPQFLDVPAEALIATMKGNQKCFHLVNADGKLLPHFIAISNLASKDPDAVRLGNERVIRPRLSDAAFFWQQDRAHPLAERQAVLKNVVFQNKLGTVYEKSERVAHLTGEIAKQLGAAETLGIRAAQLAKCDLVSEMVGEFPELQGIMGEYYARHDGENEAVAIALREQYMPRFWGDSLPETAIGQALAIAEKLDTLCGIFGIGQPPTGDKDPFGLRRAALGVLRIVIEQQLPLDLAQLLKVAVSNYPDGVIAAETDAQVFDFMLERLRGYYQDRGMNGDSVEAVISCRPTQPSDADRRIRAVESFRQLPAAESLAAANKRIHNLLKKAEGELPAQPDPTYFTDMAERQLYDRLLAVSEQVKPLLSAGEYEPALQQLAELREAVDSFFDQVMVMAEDLQVRANRLAFLQQMRDLFLQIADISKLQG